MKNLKVNSIILSAVAVMLTGCGTIYNTLAATEAERLIQQAQEVYPVNLSDSPVSEEEQKCLGRKQCALLEKAVAKTDMNVFSDINAKRWALELLGDNYAYGKQYDKAQDAYNRLANYYESDPKVAQTAGFVEYPTRLAKLYRAQGKLKDAEQNLLHAIELDDKNQQVFGEARSELCSIYMAQKQWAQAASVALKDIQVRRAAWPKAAVVGQVRSYAACQVQLKNPAPAIKLLKEEIALARADVEETKGYTTGSVVAVAYLAWQRLIEDCCELGECLEAAHDLKGAKVAYLEALKVDPRSTIAQNELQRLKKS